MKHWKVRTKRIAAAAVCLACVLAGILLAQLPLPGTAGNGCPNRSAARRAFWIWAPRT